MGIVERLRELDARTGSPAAYEAANLLEEAVKALERVPSALNAAFAAGAEECEGGSVGRQDKHLRTVDQLRSDVRATIAKIKGGC